MMVYSDVLHSCDDCMLDVVAEVPHKQELTGKLVHRSAVPCTAKIGSVS